MGWNPAKEVKKYYNRVKDAASSGLNNLKNEAEKQVGRVKWWTEQGIKKVKDASDSAKRDIEKTANSAISDAKREIEKLPGQAEKILENALEELVEAITKEGLKKTAALARSAKRELDTLAKNEPDIVDEINELGFSVDIGPMNLSFSGFYLRSQQIVDTLDTYTNNPPKFRRKPLLDMVEALGPNSVDFGINIRAAFLVASSDALSVGVSLDAIRLRLFTRLGDKLLEALGVPE